MSTTHRDELGLFAHRGAMMAISQFVEFGVVGRYPLYLVGLALPEHRGGPALVTLLTLPDGSVLEARARSTKASINSLLKYDVHYCEADDLRRYRRIFYQDLGGFGAAGCLEASPTVIAEELLSTCDRGLRFGSEVGPNPNGPPEGYPSDWTDVVHYSQGAIGCTVEGVTPTIEQILAAPVPERLRQKMSSSASGPVWLKHLREAVARQVDPDVSRLVEEAWEVQVISPRSSIVLLRTVAELVAVSLTDSADDHLARAIKLLEKEWEDDPPETGPEGRQEAAWRAAVLADMDTLRDLGRRIHAQAAFALSEDVERALSAARRLIETVLRVSPLHRPGGSQ